jgi:hypothetical protein
MGRRMQLVSAGFKKVASEMLTQVVLTVAHQKFPSRGVFLENHHFLTVSKEALFSSTGHQQGTYLNCAVVIGLLLTM